MNRMHLIAAAAALVAASAAQALTPAEIEARRPGGVDAAAKPLNEFRIAGASALRLSVAAYMKEICSSSTFHVYHFSPSANDHRAYACELAVAQGSLPVGASVLVYKRDVGGSTQGVAPIVNAATTPQTHMAVSAASCGTVVNATPGGDASVANYRCTGTENVTPDAGISDVEPALLQQTINLPSGTGAVATSGLNSAPLVQAVFGVAVNKKAYVALQKAQGILPVNATAEEIAAADPPADQDAWTEAQWAQFTPSLPRSWVAAYLSGGLFGGAANTTQKRGWNLVIPTTVDANVLNKTINVCRRTEGSGTQAVSNAFFLNNGCQNVAASAFAPLGVAGSSGNDAAVTPRVSSAPLVVEEGTSAGQVEDCVGNEANNAADGDGVAYALAWLGREANPKRAGGDLGYRYVKLDGKLPLRSVAKAGEYPAVYEATMQWNTTVVTAGSARESFLSALRTGFGKASALAAVDGDTQQGVMAPPSTYAGTYVDQVGDVAKFGSRVARASANSCADLRIVK